jgi:hypothetical protein
MATKRRRSRRAPARRRSRKKVGAISTGTVALIGGALVLGYLVTRPKTTALPLPAYPPGYIPVAAGNPTVTALNDGTSVLNNLFNNIF